MKGIPAAVTGIIPLCALIAMLQMYLPADARGEYFKYKDASGAVVITNKLENVPKKYRKSVKVIWDDELVARDPHARRMEAAEARREEQLRKATPKREEQGSSKKLQPSDGKTLVITYDEETGQLIRTME
jgi:hypothetical protein